MLPLVLLLLLGAAARARAATGRAEARAGREATPARSPSAIGARDANIFRSVAARVMEAREHGACLFWFRVATNAARARFAVLSLWVGRERALGDEGSWHRA